MQSTKSENCRLLYSLTRGPISARLDTRAEFKFHTLNPFRALETKFALPLAVEHSLHANGFNGQTFSHTGRDRVLSSTLQLVAPHPPDALAFVGAPSPITAALCTFSQPQADFPAYQHQKCDGFPSTLSTRERNAPSPALSTTSSAEVSALANPNVLRLPHTRTLPQGPTRTYFNTKPSCHVL